MDEAVLDTGTRVAVITRTLNRSIFLERAASSVLNQSFKDVLWVIVNDGGDPAPVEAVAARARVAGAKVEVLHHAVPTGMEAASNAGIAMSGNAQYLAIHDDDDTWQPEFLARTVSFLDACPRYVAVVTHCQMVREKQVEERFYTQRTRPMNHGLRHISITDLYERNLFPPISLLFRRTAYETVGHFDEGLPVQGDWDFNLRLIMHGDIAVIPQHLANYHVRPDAPAKDASSNSVQGRRELHWEYETLIRNRMLRAALQELGTSGGVLFATLARAKSRPTFVSRLWKRMRSFWFGG